MKEIKLNNISLYQFEGFNQFPNVVNFTSTRIGGISKGSFAELNIGLHVGDNPSKVLENRKILAKAIGIEAKDFTCGEQVHGSSVSIITENEKGRGALDWFDAIPQTDALITNIIGIPLMVVTADCAAVSILDTVNRAIGLVHSGKKGTMAGIVPKTIGEMEKVYGSKVENLVVGIGPNIGKCCYEIDLNSEIKTQLLKAGVKNENIEFSNICTACRNDLFYSYRAQKAETGRFANILLLNS